MSVFENNFTSRRFKNTSSLKMHNLSTDSIAPLTIRFNQSTVQNSIDKSSVKSKFRQGKATYMSVIPAQFASTNSTVSVKKILKDKLRFKEKDGVFGLEQLIRIKEDCSSDKSMTKHEMLPGLINIVRDCLEQNQELKQ